MDRKASNLLLEVGRAYCDLSSVTRSGTFLGANGVEWWERVESLE